MNLIELKLTSLKMFWFRILRLHNKWHKHNVSVEQRNLESKNCILPFYQSLSKQREKQNNVKYFLPLLQEGLKHDIYKTVDENQLEQKRKIYSWITYFRWYHCIETCFEQNWKELTSVILIAFQLFNQRNRKSKKLMILWDTKIWWNVTSPRTGREKGKTNYVHFLIRVKLSRGVQVMVHKENLIGIQMILEYRKYTNISAKNHYLFSLPGTGDYNSLLASRLLNKFS